MHLRFEYPSILEVAETLGLPVQHTSPGKAWTPCLETAHQHDCERPRCGLSDVDGGVFHCLKCGDKGDVVGLVKRVLQCGAREAFAWLQENFNMPEPNRSADGQSDPITRLAKARGISVESLRKLGARDSGNGEVHFPMWDERGEVTGWRRRRADNKPFGGGRKALSTKGGKNGLLGTWPLPEGNILLTEGEMDAAAAIDSGWTGAVLATPGATPGKRVDECLQRVAAGRRVVMAPDPDQDNDDAKSWRTRIARNLVRAGCEVRIITAVNDQDLDKRLRTASDPAAELTRLISGAIPWTDSMAEASCKPNGAAKPDDNYPLTDLGNAERFKSQHGDSALFDPSAGWRVQDGKRWILDASGEIHRLAHATAKSIFDEAARTVDPDKAAKIAQHAIRSQSRERLAAIPAVAQHLMSVDPRRFDEDPWLLNCLNGTLDLKTGELRPHRREDHITRLAPVEYHRNATHPAFEKVIAQAMPDPEVRRYAQKLFGITLIGEQVDDHFVLLYGPGGTAKTTIVEPYKKLLGDYAATVEPESLMMMGRGGAGAARGDIARLNGVRFALTTEVEDGAKLAVGLVKRLCGGDTITARKLYRDEFEFVPRFTLWIVSNHRPRADSEDDGLWRRVKVLPFDQVIPPDQRDPKIKQSMLTDCLPAFLRWATEGVALYLKEGLKAPVAVTSAIADYQESMDPLKDFLDACCIVESGARVDSSELRKAYLSFCDEERVKYPLSSRQFGERLRGMGFRPFKSNGCRWLEGLALESGTEGTERDTSSLTFYKDNS